MGIIKEIKDEICETKTDFIKATDEFLKYQATECTENSGKSMIVIATDGNQEVCSILGSTVSNISGIITAMESRKEIEKLFTLALVMYAKHKMRKKDMEDEENE